MCLRWRVWCLGWRPWQVSTAGFALGGGWSELAIVLWLDGCLGVEPRIGLGLAWRPPWWGVGGPCPFSFTTWHLPYNWGKGRKTSARIAEQCWVLLVRLGRLVGVASTGLLYSVFFGWPWGTSDSTWGLEVDIDMGHEVLKRVDSRLGQYEAGEDGFLIRATRGDQRRKHKLRWGPEKGYVDEGRIMWQ
jgi:hypothetical protein